MLVVIPFHEGDKWLAERNLEWALKLDGGKVDFDCLLAYDTETNPDSVRELAASYFRTVHELKADALPGDRTWPRGANDLWQKTAVFLYSQFKWPPGKQQWLWWEPDATPVKRDWLVTLNNEGLLGGKPFCGATFPEPKPGYMAGVGIYPVNVCHYSTDAFLIQHAPFDIVIGATAIQHVHPINHLIQHTPIQGGMSFVGDEWRDVVNPTAVLFHKCKDGSLIDRLDRPKGLLDSLFAPKKENAVTVVITNFKRPEFLKAAFHSAVVAGASSIVVTSSGATPEVEAVHEQIKKSRPETKIVSERGDSGCNANWLAGVKAAPTDWVTLLHDDDLLMPEFRRVEKAACEAVNADKKWNLNYGFILWEARKHGMNYNEVMRILDLPTGVYPSKKLLRNVMIKDSFTLSPTIGCFRKDDLIETLKEARSEFKDDYHLTPTMMVGNDLLIWLRAIQKHRYLKYIAAPLTSFGHHEGSTTCDEVFNKRGRLGPIYNRVREHFISTFPRILHVVPRYKPTDPETQRRIAFAEASWQRLYSSGMVVPIHISDLKRDSSVIGDERKTPFLKDVLKRAVSEWQWRDKALIMLTNDDAVLHPDLPWHLFDTMIDEPAVCAFRQSFHKGNPPDFNKHRDFFAEEAHDWGRDLFVFTPKWIRSNFELIPDYVLGASDWDSTFATLIRMSKGIPATKETWVKRDPRCELPTGFVYHEAHQAFWSTPENRVKLPGNLYNRELTKKFIAEHGVGWFV